MFVAVISSLAALKVFDEIYVLTNQTGGILDSGVTIVFYLWRQAFLLQHAGYASAIAIALLVITLVVLDRQRPDPRARAGRGMSGSFAERRSRSARRRRRAPRAAARAAPGGWRSTVGWYVVLTAIAVITVFPFFWMLLTSLKGPTDPISSVPPQFLPGNPTLANYERGARRAADPEVLPEQRHRRGGRGRCSTCWSRRWPRTRWPRCGSPAASAIFYLLLATLIVPAQLTYIPSFVLAVNVFHYYDTLPALIFPNLVSAFNIFLLRQAFRGRAQRPASMRPASTAPASGGSGGRSCCRSSGRRSRRSRSSRSSRPGTTSCGRR